ncbi:MAG: valine--tRNA ligase [Patescibacteria group bacterium]
MDKSFNFIDLEKKIYHLWEETGAFTPKIEEGKKPYTIIMPPPNAYDQLHIGHALFVTVEDIMIRYHRLKGEPTLWLPGADHAGLGSQVFFDKLLQKERGISRFELGREKFVEELGRHMDEKRKIMENQLRALGASCDWSRSKFTLDPDVSHAVYYTFKKMYDEGLIYRGERIVNWCSKCATGLSDLEVEHQEVEGQLAYIKYPLADGSGFVTVATTRPETMLGDTAVAVNPDDKRYKEVVGKMVKLPLTDREIPVIADEAVDKEFGTGAVKVTPAHDPTDFEIGQRHNLPLMSVIDDRNKMTEAAGSYAGMKVGEAREKVLADLQEQSLIEKQVKHIHSVGHCVKCGTILEPKVSKQWFVKIAPLAKPALAAVKTGKIKFIPERFEKIYSNWMENIRDWNISRQVWWGHRVPVWYCKNQTGIMSNVQCPMSNGGEEEFVVAETRPEKCPICGKCEMKQDEDTLDTWFSSGLWPFTTLGWPEKTADFKYFYPTTMMETAYDIIFFWVARMIMMGLYCTGEVPFETVFFNGLVRDNHGQKISKSKGNVIDPLVMVEKYGADALRMGLIAGTAAGNDTNISEDKIRAYRNFANKIWNAARFMSGIKNQESRIKGWTVGITDVALNERDREVLKEFDEAAAEMTKMMEKYQLGQAGEFIYDYFWHTFCDKIIEEYKDQLEDENRKEAASAVLHHVLRNALVLLHPFVPFATEAVWMELYEGQLISARWPK